MPTSALASADFSLPMLLANSARDLSDCSTSVLKTVRERGAGHCSVVGRCARRSCAGSVRNRLIPSHISYRVDNVADALASRSAATARLFNQGPNSRDGKSNVFTTAPNKMVVGDDQRFGCCRCVTRTGKALDAVLSPTRLR